MLAFRGCITLSFVSAFAFPSLLGAQTDADLLSHGKVLGLLKAKHGLSSLITAPGVVEASPELPWLPAYLAKYQITYSLDTAVVTQTSVIFPAANTKTGERYFLMALRDSQNVIGMAPVTDHSAIRLFDIGSGRSIEISPFTDAAPLAAAGNAAVGFVKARRNSAIPALEPTTEPHFDAKGAKPEPEDVFGTASCIWNQITGGLSNAFGSQSWGWSQLAGLVCSFRTASDDVKQMIDLATSIGGCATGGWFDCANATLEISLMVGNQSCRPDWMNACFATPAFSLLASPPSQSIAQGQSAVFSIGATFTGGFTGPISSFSVSNLQAGASYYFTAPSIATASDGTQLIITTTSSAVLGTNTLTISATGGGITNTTTVQLIITQASGSGSGSGNFSDEIVSKIQSAGTGCSDPPSSASFLTTDGTVYLYFYASTTLSDHITSDWLAPDTSVVRGGDWSNPVSGYYCYTGVSLNISGLPSNQLGNWKARVYDNGVPQFSVPFMVSGSGSGSFSPAPPPAITGITPQTVSVGINNTFIVTGTGFQQGFSGKLWVGSNSFPLNLPGQNIWLGNPNQVELVVQVGAIGDPTTSFGLQIVNPDQQASAIYKGLTAQGGGAAGGTKTPNLSITFSPNPVPNTGGTWSYTVKISETGGAPVTLTGLTVGGNDYSASIAQWFGSNQLPAYGSLSQGFKSTGSPQSLMWTLIGGGMSWSASVTLSQ